MSTMTSGSNFTDDRADNESLVLEPLSVLEAFEPQLDPVAAVTVPIVFSFVFVIGMIGNSLQVYTVLGNASMRRSPPNILIAGLGVGDLLLLLITVPFSSTVYTLTGWPFGSAVCKLSTAAYSASLAVSVLTLTAMSADRYIAIVRPLTALRVSTRRRSLMVTAGIWMTALALATVEFVAAEVRKVYPGIDVCESFPPEWGEWYEQFLPMFRFVAMFLGPLIAIGVFYAGIARVLLASQGFGEGNNGVVSTPVVVARLLDRQDHERRRVAKVVLSFVFVFIVCWLPRHIFIICYYWTDLKFNLFWHVFKIIGICLTFVYSCVNPLALYMFSDEFRRYFEHYLFGRCFPSRRLRPRRDTQSTMYTLDTFRGGPFGGTRASRGSIGSSFTPNCNVSVENLNSVAIGQSRPGEKITNM